MEPSDRRRHPRRSLDLPAQVALAAERPLPVGSVVDISRCGLLLRFPEQSVSVELGERVLVTLRHPQGLLHLLGDVRRRARGTDHRFYLAVELRPMRGEDAGLLAELLGDEHPDDHPHDDPRPARRPPAEAMEGARR